MTSYDKCGALVVVTYVMTNRCVSNVTIVVVIYVMTNQCIQNVVIVVVTYVLTGATRSLQSSTAMLFAIPNHDPDLQHIYYKRDLLR